LRQLPGQRMLAATRAYNKNFHESFRSGCRISVAASGARQHQKIPRFVRKSFSIFYYCIGVNLLHIIEVFQRIQQLLHLHRIIAGEFGVR